MRVHIASTVKYNDVSSPFTECYALKKTESLQCIFLFNMKFGSLWVFMAGQTTRGAKTTKFSDACNTDTSTRNMHGGPERWYWSATIYWKKCNETMYRCIYLQTRLYSKLKREWQRCVDVRTYICTHLIITYWYYFMFWINGSLFIVLYKNHRIN